MLESNNKRIAKNTIMLYFRMLLTMGVSIFTVRVVLNTLGVVDYGIHNVVGGVVTMFAFLSNTMATASQRYFAFDIGRKDFAKLRNTFSLTMLIYLIIAIIILILAQTIGLWFVNHQMNIPPERMSSANWVYQYSILSFMMNMFVIPYNALIIARERMNVYAWVSIIEVLLKLIIVYFLLILPGDKLKVYAMLLFAVSVIVTLIYRTYCLRKYEESRLSFFWDKELFKEMISYSGWNLFGALSGVFNGQGLNIILNIFFGPIVNTARGIAFQISSSVNMFVLNFMTATRPQITKYYASGDKDNLIKLVFQSSKVSFFLLFILGLPIILETKIILNFWLTDVPVYTTVFTKLIIIAALIDSISYSLQTAAQATGKIKLYQAIVGGAMILNLPIAYVFLILEYSPVSVFYVSIVNSIVCLFLRLIMLNLIMGFSISKYVVKVILPCLFVAVSVYVPLICIFNFYEQSFSRLLVIFIVGSLLSIISFYYFGLTKSERHFVVEIIKIKKTNSC